MAIRVSRTVAAVLAASSVLVPAVIKASEAPAADLDRLSAAFVRGDFEAGSTGSITSISSTWR